MSDNERNPLKTVPFHVHTSDGRLFETMINTQNVGTIRSPSHTPGSAVPPYNTIITMIGGEQVCAVEPRDVVMSLFGHATMDSGGTSGYYIARQDTADKDNWFVERKFYDE